MSGYPVPMMYYPESEPVIPLEGLLAWYDPSDITTLFQDVGGTTPVTASGQNVRYMLDKSGNGNHIPWVAGTTLTYQESAGLQYLDSTNTYMEIASFAGVNALSQLALYSAWDRASVNNAIFFDLFNAGVTARAMTLQITSPASLYLGPLLTSAYLYNVGATGGYGGAPKVISTRFDGTLAQSLRGGVRINGVDLTLNSAGAANSTTTNATRLRLLSLNTGGSGSSSGKFYGLALYNRVLSGDELDQVEDYYAAKAGITI